MATLEKKAQQLDSRLTALERSMAGALNGRKLWSLRAPPVRPGLTRPPPTNALTPQTPLSPKKITTGLAVGAGAAPAAAASVSRADLVALRELLLSAKQERDALAKAKAQAEERAARLEYRVSMLVASLREADKALGKSPPPPMPDRKGGAAGAAAAAAADEQDEDDAAAAEVA
jgi:hypothetical protein